MKKNIKDYLKDNDGRSGEELARERYERFRKF
jgi:hypothetical protein